VKPQPKASAKTAKAAPKAKARTAAKAASTKAKPAAKPAAKKAVAKAPAKKVPAKKTPAKVPAKAAKKPAAKPAAKPATAVAKPAAKPAAKNAAPVKAPAKAPVKAAAPAKKTTTPMQPAPKAASVPKAPAPAGQPTPVAAAPAPVRTAGLQAIPPRATKPSARLAQITVPSMAQSVASTAAKASYIQTPASPVLTPPPLVAVKKDPKLANNWKTKSAEELSDEEVLAMPDSEYMNDKQLAFFRRKLWQLKQDILNNAGETTEHLREDTVIVPDPADRATIEEEHALELRTRDRERKLLKKIEQSIARIDAGDYGYCDETGEPIGVGRLLARPTATLSLEAQQRRELKQKMFGD
jgi:DnaK suppressor protein